MSENSVIKIMMVIVDRDKGESIVDFLRERNIFFNLILLGKGTASSQWADFMGLGDSKKDIVISAVEAERVNEVLKELDEEFKLHQAGRGVAFTVKIDSVGSKRFLNYCLGIQEDK